MVKFVKGALLTVTVSLALGGLASATPTLTDAEFKCQTSVSKAGSKFVGSKAKCAMKCLAGARKVPPVNPSSDCFAPYGGATLFCITDSLKGAEGKFATAIRKACDPTFKVGSDPDLCPECYSNGDCTQESIDRVSNIEGQVDSFGPGVFCDQNGANPPDADKLENVCEINTAKTLSKLVGSINKCYDKCNSNMRKSLIPPGSCNPPTPADSVTAACISAADAKSIAGINKKCGDVAVSPDCNGVTDSYPSGAAWTNLVDTAISGNVPGTYCSSPSGAFID